MTSSLFETTAKAAVAAMCVNAFGEDYEEDDIQLVWFSHVLGNKKAILIDSGKNERIYEVTYNASSDEMYVDCYAKSSKVIIGNITAVAGE